MHWHGIAAALLAAWLWATGAAAATDCARSALAQGEQLSDYLKAYADDCLGDRVAEGLRAWGVGGQAGARDLSRYVRAWHDVADAFRRLQDESAQGAQMRATYGELEQRARGAGRDLGAHLEAGKVPDVAVYRAAAWQRPRRDILLQEVKTSDGTAIVARLLQIDLALDGDCREAASELCSRTLADGKTLMLELELASGLGRAFSRPTVKAIAAQVEAKNALWDTYLYDSKPMLPFDFVLTDLLDGRWAKSDQYPQGFREPPATQWFLLHPSVGVEYASAAADGEHLQPVLYVEIIGANRWNPRNRWINLPLLDRLSGISLVASFADRVGTDNSGAGVLLTFDNVYSLGITRYGSTTGVFLSLDLASLYRENLRPRYESFRESLQELRPRR